MRARTPWTVPDLVLLILRYADERTTDLAASLNRPTALVYAQAGRMGLRKGDAFLATTLSGRINKGGQLGQDRQWQPGHVPWNKGKPMPTTGRMAATQFKPGNKPHTWVPVGTLRLCDGYLQRKVTDLGHAKGDWIGVHRYVWEQAHGPTPPGHVVVFRPGRRTLVEADITLDAVELIHRRELMRRNSMHSLPKELMQLIHLRGVLTRQINARSTKP